MAPVVANRRHATISMQIYRQLRDLIVTGRLVPRQLLSENELAAKFGVSRTPVREAFGKLEEDGLIAIVPQQGTFVTPIVPKQVYANQFIREALECACLARAAENSTAGDAAELRVLLARQRAAKDDASFFQADEDLHRRLMTIGGHGDAWPVVQAAKLHLDRVRYLAVRNQFKRRSIVREHGVIVDHVVAGEAEAAVQAMHDHLRGVYATIDAIMREHAAFFADDQVCRTTK